MHQHDEGNVSESSRWLVYVEWLNARGLSPLPPVQPASYNSIGKSASGPTTETAAPDIESLEQVTETHSSKAKDTLTLVPLEGKSVVFAVDSNLSDEQRALLQNMLQATRLRAEEHLVVPLEWITELDFDFSIEKLQIKQLVVFANDQSSFLPAQLRPLKRAQLLPCETATGFRYISFKLPPICDLEASPQLKRPVWNAIKRYIIDPS